MDKQSKIFVAGHRGMVGSACVEKLQKEGWNNLILPTRATLDLTNQQQTNSFMETHQPDIVILAAAKVGGIQANINNPAAFLHDNLSIQLNVIEASRKYGVKKLVNISSSCIYPRNCPQPMSENYLLDGKPEPTNEGYAIAKIAGLKLSVSYKKEGLLDTINLIPCNLYGKNDDFNPENSHVMAALIRRFVDAKEKKLNEITLWGTGSAKREFMNVEDLSEGIFYFLTRKIKSDYINIGCGEDVSIKDLAQIIAKNVGFKGKIKWDESKPDGMPRKCMNVSQMKTYGFEPKIKLVDGIKSMIELYKQQKSRI